MQHPGSFEFFNTTIEFAIYFLLLISFHLICLKYIINDKYETRHKKNLHSLPKFFTFKIKLILLTCVLYRIAYVSLKTLVLNVIDRVSSLST